MITDEIRTHLLTETDISDLVGNRIFAIALPQEVDFPAVTFILASNNRVNTMDGVVASSHSRIRFHVYTETYEECKVLSQAIRKKMDLLPSEVGIVSSNSFLGMNDGDLETDLDLRHRVLEFMVYFNEN